MWVFLKKLIFLLILLCSLFAKGQNDSLFLKNTNLYSWIDLQLETGLVSYNIPGLTFSLVYKDSVIYSNGYGIESLETKKAVTADNSIFHIASISKTFVATAIMQLVERGKLDLNTDVNQYLSEFQIDFDERPITIEHLLQHIAGFDERNLYTTVLNVNEVISLENHLKDRMPPQIRESGESHTYSNYGFALLGYIVEVTSGMSFEEYIETKILNPLEMNSSGFKMKSSNNYVSSYLQTNDTLVPYSFDYPLNYPAASFSTSSSDMANYIQFFLNKGNFNGKQVLAESSANLLFSNEFKHFPDSKNGYALGFFTSKYKGYDRFGHSGVKQGFASDFILIPEKNIGLFLCVNASSYPKSNTRVFMNKFIEALLSKLISDDSNINKITIPIKSNKEIDLSQFEGSYRFTRYAQTTLDKLGVLIGLAPEITVISNGNQLEIVEWNEKLNHIKDRTFYDFENNTYRAFGLNSKNEVEYFFSNGTRAYHKLKWFEKLNFQLLWIGSIVIVLVMSLLISIFRRILVRNRKSNPIRKLNNIITLLIFLFLGLLGYVLITTDPMQFVYGVPTLLKIVLVIPFVFIILQGLALKVQIDNWNEKIMKNYALIYHTIILIISIAIIPWMLYWNLLGFNY